MQTLLQRLRPAPADMARGRLSAGGGGWRSPWALGCLCLVMALAQTWGLLHRQAHGPLPALGSRLAALTPTTPTTSVASVASVASAGASATDTLVRPSAAPASPPAAWPASVGGGPWGHEPGSADCTLLDQLLHAAVPASDSAWLTQAPPAAAPGWPPGPVLHSGGHAAYLARGPPLA